MQSTPEESSKSPDKQKQLSIHQRATKFDYGVASNVAGSLTAICFHPLDLIKVRIVSQDGTDLRKHRGQNYKGFLHAFTSILKLEGPMALFRGAPLGMVASGIVWGLYMVIYRWTEESLLKVLLDQKPNHQRDCQNQNSSNKSSSEELSTTTSPTSTSYSSIVKILPVSAVASASSSVLVSFMTTPMFLIKTRMMLEDVDAKSTTRINRTFYHGVREAVARDGVASLWRGFSAQLVMCCVMSLYLPLYESIRFAACQRWEKQKLSKTETAGVTIVAKLGVTTASHPVGLIKARLQDARARGHAETSATATAAATSTNHHNQHHHHSKVKYVSFTDTVKTIMHREGLRGFYRGITVGLAQSTSRSIFQMLIYEDVLAQVVGFREAKKK